MKKKLKLAEGGGVSIDYIYPTYEEFRKSMGEVGQFLFNAAIFYSVHISRISYSSKTNGYLMEEAIGVQWRVLTESVKASALSGRLTIRFRVVKFLLILKQLQGGELYK